MKTQLITVIATAFAVVSLSSFSLAGPAASPPKSDKMPAATLQEIQIELKKTQAELQQALARIAALEQRVNSLQQANAKLEQEVKRLGQPRLVPLEHK
jgi:peptidoglycan hydrolase CwlO-like protein